MLVFSGICILVVAILAYAWLKIIDEADYDYED